MTFRIPSPERKLSQPNSSDVNGNLYATRNIDLDEEGYIKLSAGVVSIFSESDDADFRNLNTIFHGSEPYMFGTNVFKTTIVSFDNFFVDATTANGAPSPGAEEDGIYFNGSEVISDTNVVQYNLAGTWTTISGTTAPAAGEPSVMCVFPNQNSLLFATGNRVQRINTSWTVAQTLTLPADYAVLSMDTNGNYAYIATRHKKNGEAMLFQWTGINTTNDGAYGVGTFEISTVKKYKSTVAMVDSLGRLLAFTGNGFEELASLPAYYSRANWGDATNEYSGITNRGMVVDGDLIYLNINPEVEDVGRRMLPNMPGGIWCYDPKVGLYHKYSASKNTVLRPNSVMTAGINTTTDVITISGTTVPATGSPVFYKRGASAIGGLSTDRYYYIIRLTSTTFKLAETYEDAMNDVAINLTSASDAQTFFFIQENDYGDVFPGDKNFVLSLNNAEYRTKQLGRICFSSDCYGNTGTQIERFNIICPVVRNRGHFITPKMFAEDVEDAFKSVTLRFKPLKFGDKIIVKYKDADKANMPATLRSIVTNDNLVTWTSTTTFTTIATPNEQTYNFSTLTSGDEIEIIGGAGAGYTGVVLSVSKSGLQYTVVLTEAVPFVSVNDTSMVQASNFKLLDTITHTENLTRKTIAIDTESSWLQIKVIMEGVDVVIEDVLVNNTSYQKSR
jgi:hypothetical protein